jgi:hypothetical protein
MKTTAKTPAKTRASIVPPEYDLRAVGSGVAEDEGDGDMDGDGDAGGGLCRKY